MMNIRREVKKIHRCLNGIISLRKRHVDFVIAGTQKGGTTALKTYLQSHPEICITYRKEGHFFDRDPYFQNKAANSLCYHLLFDPKPHHKIIGESTPIYMYWYDAPRRIWHYNSNMKIIIILRNPIERAYSHWNMERDRNKEILSFWDAIKNEQERCHEALPYQHRIYSYIDRGFYVEQLRRIWSFFPISQTLILRNEDLRTNPKETIDKACNFLGVSNLQNIKAKTVHSGHYISRMNRKEIKFLQQTFEHEIRYLERILGWDCSNWLT